MMEPMPRLDHLMEPPKADPRPSCRVEVQPLDDFVRISEGYALPSRFEAVITPEDTSLPACRVVISLDGSRPVCDVMALERQPGTPPLTGTTIRVPLANYVRQAADAATYWLVPRSEVPMMADSEGVLHQPYGILPFDETHVACPIGGPSLTKEWRAATRTPRELGVIDDETLREVADVYTRALARREPPRIAVAEEWQASKRTASRLIERAKKAGLL